ncbi:hypothetical protein KAJ38_01160 [Candidatus Pacearchaeota archaeon]|nr:hypothetical protein [Candidatus Pacearchaeota archaeon]
MTSQNTNIKITPSGELKKCSKCKTYTLQEICKKCSYPTKSAHYKFPQIRDAPPRSANFKRR